MSNWTNYNEIKKVLNRKWDKGYILKSAFIEDNFFSLSITIKGPTIKDFEQLPEIIKWIKDLSKYEIISLQNKEINSRVHGKNLVPACAVIENVTNAVQIIKKQKELKSFLYNANALVSEFPNLQNWIVKKAIKVSEIEDVNSLIKVLNWFLNTNDTNVYLREICIEGIHTKFIEKNKTIISEMLDEILSKEKVNFEFNKFEDRYNLKSEELTVRFRILDDEFKLCGLNDIRVPLSDFEKIDLKVENIFFTENLTNFLSFPKKKSSSSFRKRLFC